MHQCNHRKWLAWCGNDVWSRLGPGDVKMGRKRGVRIKRQKGLKKGEKFPLWPLFLKNDEKKTFFQKWDFSPLLFQKNLLASFPDRNPSNVLGCKITWSTLGWDGWESMVSVVWGDRRGGILAGRQASGPVPMSLENDKARMVPPSLPQANWSNIDKKRLFPCLRRSWS